MNGFRIVGDAATPLAVGIDVTGSSLSIVDVEVTGATKAGILFGESSSAALAASDIHDNPGAAIMIRAGAAPRITHSTFGRNGLSEHASGGLVIEHGSTPVFTGNVFVDLTPDAFMALDEAARTALRSMNWFLPHEPVRARPTPGGGRNTP
jgi:hypothetical protein